MALPDQLNVVVRRSMRVKDSEINLISGGGSVGSTFLNYLSTAIKTIYSIGQDLGGAIRRIATDNVCPIL